MWPYLLLIAAPGAAAITGVRRTGVLLIVVALLYWFIVGWRFQIGVDWNNYLHIYDTAKYRSLGDLIAGAEPGFSAVLWLASITGGGLILVNVIAALVFCWGFFAFAKRCSEPFLAISVATPLLVVALAMSGIRQAMAVGVIYYLFATWEKKGTLRRSLFVLLASAFHLSALFSGIFVALGARLTPPARIAAATLILATILVSIWLFPDRFEFYSEAYVGAGSISSPGALAHVAVVAASALIYFSVRRQWQRVFGDSVLVKYLAITALMMLPAIYISSVAASRLSFYLWPVAMYVLSGLPMLLRSTVTRYFYRAAVVICSILMLVLWLQLANSGWAYLPYRNWLLEPEQSSLLRRR